MRVNGFLIVMPLVFAASTVFAQVYGRNYGKENGYQHGNSTVVNAHYRIKPNNDEHDNWMAKGYIHPLNGQGGTRKVRLRSF